MIHGCTMHYQQKLDLFPAAWSYTSCEMLTLHGHTQAVSCSQLHGLTQAVNS